MDTANRLRRTDDPE
jgi:ferredoxin